ncbi:MAG: glucose-6-phosphate isomerase [Burkholderiaceae bacterium]|nr:glucose-6-phosphate isomerase [Burkholderiaceae bacterium]MBP7660702.1 glucose-6-phosphate isomerase [Burkholderiaceae bacterium]
MNPSDRQHAMRTLDDLAGQARSTTLRQLFADEPERVDQFTLEAAGLTLDLSRQRMSVRHRDALLRYAAQAGIAAQAAAMMRGDIVNPTEGRRAWHTALRAPAGAGQPPEVGACLQRMSDFAQAVRSGAWTGERGLRLTDIVHVGIGGSHLGPQMACEALTRFADPGLRVHFLSNVDPAAWSAMQRLLDPDRTLVIVASKSWRTLETARNMDALLQWLREAGITESGLGRHLAGVTAAPDLARASGIGDATLFPFWDWVGGRYSLWSAIGLPLMLAIGPDAFKDMLAGAHAMDTHFAQAPTARNAPLMLALTALWNRLLAPGATDVVAPYCDPLKRLPSYLQQLQMESDGKSVGTQGEPLPWRTVTVTWGAAGTDAQHSFFQALHQGTDVHPVEFVLALPDAADPQRRDEALLANAIAQAQALMLGRSRADVITALRARGLSAEQAERDAGHQVHPGDRPSTTLLIGRLSPHALGALIAMYEHKTVALAWLWGINPFDQWGVELGKQMAGPIEEALAQRRRGVALPEAIGDPATRAWIERVGTALALADAVPDQAG